MKKLEKIKEHLLTIIQKEEIKTQSEIEELSQKQRDNMDFYGIGGPYQRYEQAIDRRKKHLSELEALRKAQNSAILLESLRLFKRCSFIFSSFFIRQPPSCPLSGKTH